MKLIILLHCLLYSKQCGGALYSYINGVIWRIDIYFSTTNIVLH